MWNKYFPTMHNAWVFPIWLFIFRYVFFIILANTPICYFKHTNIYIHLLLAKSMARTKKRKIVDVD